MPSLIDAYGRNGIEITTWGTLISMADPCRSFANSAGRSSSGDARRVFARLGLWFARTCSEDSTGKRIGSDGGRGSCPRQNCGTGVHKAGAAVREVYSPIAVV
jgi:hypothetical protein